MPTYQYACTECGEHLEVVQSFSDATLTECPACQGKLRKVFNSVGIVFKGSGFYRNDSRKSGSSTETSQSSNESSAASSKPSDSSSGKSESKPAATTAKTETKAAPAASAT